MKGLQFSTEEKQLLIEVLLFASTPDVCAEFTPRQEQLMIDLAKKLNEEGLRISNVYLFEGGVFDNKEHVEKITKAFPNLPRTSIITD